MDEFSITEGVEFRLEKHIPVAAGMAGGSTDAAAALYGMNQMFDLGLNMEQLKERGVKIGADVPYCLDAWNRFSRGNRREVNSTSADAKMSGFSSEAIGCGFYKIRI